MRHYILLLGLVFTLSLTSCATRVVTPAAQTTTVLELRLSIIK